MGMDFEWNICWYDYRKQIDFPQIETKIPDV